jgi:hypothetical protein
LGYRTDASWAVTLNGFQGRQTADRQLPPAAIDHSGPRQRHLFFSEYPKCRFSPDPNQFYICSRPVPPEGRLAIVTDAGRDAVDAGGASDEGAFLRTAKSCGPDAPTLASSSAQ